MKKYYKYKKFIKEVKTHPRAFSIIILSFILGTLFIYGFPERFQPHRFSLIYLVGILVGAIVWGKTVAFFTCLLSYIFLLPFFVDISWNPFFSSNYFNIDLLQNLILFLIVSTLTGFLSDRERKEKKKQTKLSRQLHLLNRELDRKILHSYFLFEVSRELSSAKEFNELLEKIMDVALKIMDAEFSSLWLLDKKGDELICKAAYGVQTKFIEKRKMKIGEGITGYVAETGKPLIVDDLSKEPRYKNPLKREVKLKNELSVPLKVKGKIIGVLNVFNKREVEEFTKDDLQTLSQIAGQIAISIENSHLYEEQKNKLLETEFLHNLGKQLITMIDLEDILLFVVEKTKEIFKASSVSILLLDEEKNVLRVEKAIGMREGEIEGKEMPFGEGISSYVVRKGKSIIINSEDDLKKYSLVPLSHQYCRSLCVPLKMKGKTIGVLCISRENHQKIFTKEDNEFANALSNLTSLSIEKHKLYFDLIETNIRTMQALAFALDARDSYTKGHSERTVGHAVKIARELNLPEKEIKILEYAAALHDVGKIGISDDILNKPSKLTQEEFEAVKNHVHIGAKIVAPVEFLKDAIPLIYHHHERYDGRGYPFGLKEEEIPVGARILCVVDAYEAMTSDRPYRKALSTKQAINELKKWSGIQFDPTVVEVFLNIIKKDKIN
jgi:response regulator RpfG family c-di-GMP phosphodiesterase